MINQLTYGLNRILIQILLSGLSRCRIQKDFVANWGQFSSISMSMGENLKYVKSSSSLPSIRAVLLPGSVKFIVKWEFRSLKFLPYFFTILLLIVRPAVLDCRALLIIMAAQMGNIYLILVNIGKLLKVHYYYFYLSLNAVGKIVHFYI